MKKVWIIIKREYKINVFKKSFIIMTILTPLIMMAMGIVPSLLMMMDTEERYDINLIDKSNLVATSLQKELADTLKTGELEYTINAVDIEGQVVTTVLAEQKELINNDQIDGLIYIPGTIADSGKIEYYSKNIANIDLNRRIRNGVNEIVANHRILKSGLDPKIIDQITRRSSLRTIKIVKGGEETERGFLQEYFGTFIFVLILYMSLIMYGTSIMRGIIEEKSTRIIEVLLSSANSMQLMAGKILGLGSVGLTQYLIWASVGIIFFTFGEAVFTGATDYITFEPAIFIYFVLFYILGYFVFAALYAAIGAVTNSDQEAQNLAGPVIMILIVPLLILGLLVKNPNSAFAITMSMIPFFSPIIMFTRINLADPSMIEILSSIGILMITIIVLIWIVAKIYRVGILMYGKRPNIPEIVKWIRYK